MLQVDVEQIESVITAVTGVTIDQVISRGSTKEISLARGMVVYFSFHRSPLTLRQVCDRYHITRQSCQNAIEMVQGGRYTMLKDTFNRISERLLTIRV